MKDYIRSLIILLAIIVAASFVHRVSRERFFNIIPTESIDPEYRYPTEAEYVSRQMYERVGDAYGVDLNCNNVDMFEIARWIHRDDPRLMNEAVLRWDPSIDPTNPNHTPRVLKLLMQNLPSYGCPETKAKYLPIIQKCFPRGVRV